jgi:hypothetical protein
MRLHMPGDLVALCADQRGAFLTAVCYPELWRPGDNCEDIHHWMYCCSMRRLWACWCTALQVAGAASLAAVQGAVYIKYNSSSKVGRYDTL